MKDRSKVRKILNLLIQVVILLATCLFIYTQVFRKTDLAGLMAMLDEYSVTPGFGKGLALAGFLMLVNWSIEAVKWKYLVGKIERVGFFNALQAVMAGIAVSSFIPNRVGEYFGRVYILKTASRIEGILITLVGSMSQLLVTILAGTAALLVFIPKYLHSAGFGHGYLYYSLAVIVAAFDILLLALFFRISFLAFLRERLLSSRFRWLRKFFRVFGFFHSRELAAVLLFSMARYLVFSAQFYLLLVLFGVAITYPDAMLLIALVYFIMAIIPTVALTELGIRGAVSLYVFGYYFHLGQPAAETGNMGVFAASTLLWLLNLGIPALVGTLFVFRLEFFRKSAA
jgi:uncharacterized membrane protein YbhN (UPF0104 family)